MKKNKAQSGFTLIEMAFVILILGLLVGSVFAFMSPQLQAKHQQQTIDRENKIARALSDYAQIQGRLPCPARPEDFSATIGTALAACGTATLRNGIVPYRSLGLTFDDVMDGYDNPISYTVSTVLSVAPNPPGTNIHVNCKTSAWIPFVPTNINPNKAALCCPKVTGTQLEIFSDTLMTTHITKIQTDVSNTGAFSTGADNSPSAATAVSTDNLNYFAYILVSHGKNGEGSYTINPVTPDANRKAFNNPGDAEKLNADNDANSKFAAIDKSSVPGTGYFDDIVLWRTQQGLIREMGNDSCSRP